MAGNLRENGVPAEVPAREFRKNVMLAAQMEADGRAVPVRIRNLSPWGAMLDGQALPGSGTRFALRRLDLAVGARAVWSREGRCGVKFDLPIDVEEWATGTYRGGRGGNQGQLRVDQIQATLRAVGPIPPVPPAAPDFAPGGFSLAESDRLLAEELMHLRRMLDGATAALSEDIEVLMRHEKALQNCDIAAAILEILARVVAAPDRAAAIAGVEMHEVRARLSGQPSA